MHRLRCPQGLKSARTSPWHCPGCTENLQQASADFADSFSRTHLCLLALVREHQRGHISRHVSVSNPQALQLFQVHSTHAVPMKAFSKYIIIKKNRFHHVRVIFNGNHCCTIQEPAHFLRNDHVGLLLKYRDSAVLL